MISVQITKSNTNYVGIQVSGHSIVKKDSNRGFFQKILERFENRSLKSEKIEERVGENVVCAGVSVLAQSLFIFCKNNDFVKSENIADGFLKFDLIKFGIESNSAFKMVEMGLKNLQEQYPKEIEIVYLKG